MLILLQLSRLDKGTMMKGRLTTLYLNPNKLTMYLLMHSFDSCEYLCLFIIHEGNLLLVFVISKVRLLAGEDN